MRKKERLQMQYVISEQATWKWSYQTASWIKSNIKKNYGSKRRNIYRKRKIGRPQGISSDNRRKHVRLKAPLRETGRSMQGYRESLQATRRGMSSYRESLQATGRSMQGGRTPHQ